MTRVMAINYDVKPSPPPKMSTESKRTANRDTIPEPNYTKLSEKIRKSTNQQLLCNMFCGGRKCKYELSNTWTEQQKALPGIFSH
ncbi:unnamed protein product [Medioppia subpectinata]|uniref:Uncharacterized protein n=1 Tax=Medioppia subpectinata TaxID=1979941 RepID=A0A7R9QBY8_9ACAR|nr:unnamed protein product [Medioppia subpectinata]CAG2117996.1 unnamed protein product [Medioppia subpectinata]